MDPYEIGKKKMHKITCETIGKQEKDPTNMISEKKSDFGFIVHDVSHK